MLQEFKKLSGLFNKGRKKKMKKNLQLESFQERWNGLFPMWLESN